MLRKIWYAVTLKLKRFTMAETSTQLEGLNQKRQLEDKETAEVVEKKAKFENAPFMQGRADRKRKVALLLAYCGAGYYGIQIQKNGNFRTIESELIKALRAAELIPEEHAETPQKMLYDENVCEKINTHLPPEIRIMACLRATRGFDSKNHCTARIYKYMLPTYAFAPVEKFITKDYRLPEGGTKRVNEVLSKYVGTRNFHNFTSGRKPNDPSSKRYIVYFECGEPFVRDGIEFVVLTVKGQSFMLHHIRKMIGLMISVVRGHCGDDVITKAWGPQKMDIPKAPGLGLFLDQLFFNGYNKKYGNDGMHTPLVWDKYQEALEDFKEKYVLSHIAKCEAEESTMFNYLGTLQFHKFDVIDPNEEVPPDGEQEKHRTWWRTRRLLKNMDKAIQEGESPAVESEAKVSSSGEDVTSEPNATAVSEEMKSEVVTEAAEDHTAPVTGCQEREKPDAKSESQA